jgi:hypothetical protein
MTNWSGQRKRGESGMRERGGQKRELLKDVSEIVPEAKRGTKIKKPETRKTNDKENTTRKQKSIETNQKENITKETKTNVTSERENIGEKTVKNTTSDRENTTIEIKSSTPERPKIVNTGETQPSVSKELSMTLRMEQLSSVKLLDKSARQLTEYAEQLAGPQKVDEEGEVIQRAPTRQIMDAVKCLDASRNMMKTKLEYLRFGVSLAKDLDKC